VAAEAGGALRHGETAGLPIKRRALTLQPSTRRARFPPPCTHEDLNRRRPALLGRNKRTVKEENGQVRLAMAVSCEADKASCDRLVREFQQLNAKVAHDVGRRGQQP
jgi:hypothetical protein